MYIKRIIDGEEYSPEWVEPEELAEMNSHSTGIICEDEFRAKDWLLVLEQKFESENHHSVAGLPEKILEAAVAELPLSAEMGKEGFRDRFAKRLAEMDWG